MSFASLKKDELKYAAEFFDVPHGPNDTKPELIAALEEKEITWANYKKFVAADGNPVEEDKPEEPPVDEKIVFNDTVLLKMDRQNPTFEILGRRFTKQQPFQVMSADEAQKIIDASEGIGGGFRIASPAEAKRFFG